MAMFDVIRPLYDANRDTAHRFLINQGGTSSGKTYTIMQRLVVLSIEHNGCVITIAGQDLPNLRVGAMRDLERIIGGSSWLSSWFTENKSGLYWRGKNMSLIEFKSYDDAQDAKNGKRDYLFVNEANGIPYDVFWQLQIRTRRQVFIDYNPSARFWAHDNIIGSEDARLIISDHRANCFLTREEHEKIEDIDDRQLFRVYARGLTGRITGLVYTNWDVVDGMPELAECKLRCYGLDFGFTNDPTALVEVRLAHGELWADEVIYSTGMTNPDIAEQCKREGIGRESLIIADSAEPKSVAELNACGLNVILATKGKDSVVNGIDILMRYPMHFTRRSKGLINEAEHYTWRAARDGGMTNVPVDAYNHALDALRYVAIKMLGTKRRGAPRAHTIKI